MVELRMAGLVVLGAYMVVTPLLVQVLGVRDRSLRAWRMFSGLNTDVCEVQLWRRTPAGDEPVDRLAALGHDSRLEAPKTDNLLKDPDALRAQARKVCAALGPGTDLRADLRCGSLEGWVQHMHRDQDLCRSKKEEG